MTPGNIWGIAMFNIQTENLTMSRKHESPT